MDLTYFLEAAGFMIRQPQKSLREKICYSAQIEAGYRKYVKMFGALISLREFSELYWERANGSKAKIPKAMDAAFVDSHDDPQREIKAAIDRFNASQATESKRIATDKIDATIRRLDDLQCTELEDRDRPYYEHRLAA